jgi:bifunctional pyridoxal-dependent enzyme with beta-cystathionase and maltose regulon repressor activities
MRWVSYQAVCITSVKAWTLAGLKISPDIQDSGRWDILQVMKIQRDAMDEDCVLSITWHEVDFYSPGFAYAQSFCVVL